MNGQSALSIAVSKGNFELVATLLKFPKTSDLIFSSIPITDLNQINQDSAFPTILYSILASKRIDLFSKIVHRLSSEVVS